MNILEVERLLASVPTGLWIGGEERPASSTFDVLNPATDEVLISVGNATAADALSAMDAACAVQDTWAATPARERGEVLRSVFEMIIERADDFATLMTLEMGKVVAESMGEVKYGAEFFRWFAEEAVRIGGRYTPSPAGTGRIIVTKQPVGPCYAITPWNFPLAMGTRKIGPALAAGCTMIVKPAQETPLTMLLLAKMRNGGEACTAANRLYVANPLLEEFTDKFVKRMGELNLGNGLDPSAKLGPLINPNQLETVQELVDDAVEKGATVAVGGQAPGGPGNFYPATVLVDVPANARILKEEVFGPVAPIVGFDTEEQGIAAANDTEYGLAAYIWTESLDRALRVAEALEAGMVGVNRGVISDPAAPFGGVKESGFGREGGYEGIEEYLDIKYIALTP